MMSIKFAPAGAPIFSEIQARQLGQLTIRQLNLSDANEKRQHDRLVGLVDELLDLKKEKPSKSEAKLPSRIERLDLRIEGEVVKIYGAEI